MEGGAKTGPVVASSFSNRGVPEQRRVVFFIACMNMFLWTFFKTRP